MVCRIGLSTRRWALLVFCTALLAFRASGAAGEEGLLFHASFEDDAVADFAAGEAKPIWPRAISIGPGRVGNAASLRRGTSTLAYRMAGNAHVSAGTLSFFWRLDQPLDRAEFEVADLGCFQKIYYGRWIRVFMGRGRMGLHFYDSYFSPRRTRFTFLEPEAGQWYHVAIAWDQSRGVAAYVDGELVRTIERPWFLDANVNHLGLGQRSSSYSPTGRSRAARDQSFDEVRVYDRWLDDAAIAALARGEAPQVPPRDLSGFLAWRRGAYAWDEQEGMPVLDLTAPLGLALRQAGIAEATDVKKLTMDGLDGQLATSWTRSGYSEAGQNLDIRLHPGQRFNAVQWFANGAFALEMPEADDYRTLFRWSAEEPRFGRGMLEETVQTDAVRIRDEESSGRMMNAWLMEATTPDQLPSLNRGDWELLALVPGDEAAASSKDGVRMAKEFAPFDRTLWTAEEGGAAEGLAFPAMRAVHFLGPEAEARRGLGAVALEIRLEPGASPSALRIEMMDPLNYNRRTFAADAAVRPGGGNLLRLVVDFRDLVIPPSTRPWLVLTLDQDARVQPGQASIAYQWLGVEEALEEFYPDQFVQACEVFSWLSESRPWGWPPDLTKWLGFLRNILGELRELRPDDAELAGYWQWINPGEQKPILELPEPPEGVPAWAFYWDKTVPLLKQAAYWWIDNRMTERGEFGAIDGINDDTCLIQDWAALHLMSGPDDKLRDAIRRVADNSWNRTMRDGLGSRTDPLHHYEWGINAQCLMALTEPGCPVAFSRLMATARHYDRLTAVTGEGRRHFVSQRYGHQGINTAGPQGWDVWGNALTLHPGMLLAWHNGEEHSLRVLREWVGAMAEKAIELEPRQRRRIAGVTVHHETGEARLGGQAFGFFSAVWAAYELTGDPKFLDFLGRFAELEIRLADRPDRTNSTFARLLAESRADAAPGELGRALEERRTRLLEAALTWLPDERLWRGSLHNPNYRPLDRFYYAWMASGDSAYLDEGMKLTLNDMTWSLPLLTEAEQSTDRVWLPQRLANRIALGDIAILRNELFPMHAVSWENATGRFAPLVKSQNRNSLHVLVHNLEQEEIQVDMRLWRLDYGLYRRRVAMNGEAHEDEIELSRYDALPLRIPAGGTAEVQLEQARALGDCRMRPDLAVTDRDAEFDAQTRRLTVRVHNIGAEPTGPFEVVARQGDRTLLRSEMDSLDAPSDLQPKTAELSISVPRTDEPVVVEVDPDGRTQEIMTINNRAVIHLQ